MKNKLNAQNAHLVLLGGCAIAALLLRLLLTFFGYEAGTGLPIRGPIVSLLPLVVLLVVWAVFAWKLPVEKEPGPGFPEGFPMTKKALLVPVAGVFLMALSGVIDLANGVMAGNLQSAMGADGMTDVLLISTVTPKTLILLGISGLVMAISLFPAVVACHKQQPLPSGILLIAPAILVLRLVLIYRIYSIDPILIHYAPELVATIFLTLSLYRLSSFAFRCGETRRFGLYAGWTVILSAAAVGGLENLSDELFFAGAILLLAGLLKSRLTAYHTAA